MPDLSALNDAERRVLALLATGHTAKSAAASLGCSEAAVNERLREARRKTGVGSSRELSRLFAAQESRDEYFEEAPAPDRSPEPDPRPAPRPAGWSKGRIAMTCTMLAAVVVGLFLATQGAGDTPKVVATGPTQDAVVPAGPVTVSVTFDRPMRGDGWSFTGDPAAYPDCATTPKTSADGRTFVLACRAEAGRSYTIGFNGGRFRNFRSRTGVPAEPYLLRFSAR